MKKTDFEDRLFFEVIKFIDNNNFLVNPLKNEANKIEYTKNFQRLFTYFKSLRSEVRDETITTF